VTSWAGLTCINFITDVDICNICLLLENIKFISRDLETGRIATLKWLVATEISFSIGVQCWKWSKNKKNNFSISFALLNPIPSRYNPILRLMSAYFTHSFLCSCVIKAYRMISVVWHFTFSSSREPEFISNSAEKLRLKWSEYLELLAPLDRSNGSHQNYISANLGRFVILQVLTSERESKMSHI
jgi:hypothetical protein